LATSERTFESSDLWFVAPRRVEIRRATLGAPRGDSFVARALASGVSQGTELLLYRGEGPTPFDLSLGSADASTYPRRYGYAWVGEVVERGESSAFSLGDRVFSLAPHGSFHRLRDADARRLPRAVPAARGVLAASLETAVTCVWDAGAELGDDVVYKVAKALHDNKADLQATFPPFALFDPAKMAKPVQGVPFHPGARKYFREAGLVK